ncbi:MAG: cation:proton antiporter [Pseudomonadota bacterium]
MPLDSIKAILMLLGIVVATSWVFWRLKLPILLGYIVIGVFVGPHVLGWIVDAKVIRHVAEFGIVLLLFTIGLKFSWRRLFSMSHLVFGYGGLQVLFCILATLLVGNWIGLTLAQSIVISGVIATSSTTLVLKQLSDQGDLRSQQGYNAIGILLFQDLAVIPFLVIIPSLVTQYLGVVLIFSLAKGVLAIVIILGLGRWILRPLFHRIAETGSSELFTFVALLVVLGSAWFSHMLGLSHALGSFVAGVLLAETEFRHQLDVEMRPFRDVLLALFFISIGMEFEIVKIPETWPWIFLLFSALVVFKAVLISILGLLFGLHRSISLQTGIILAQGSEFGFSILFLASRYNVLPPDYSEVVLGALLMSIAVSSLLIHYHRCLATFVDGIAQFIFPFLKTRAVVLPEAELIPTGLREHVIICGFSEIGHATAKVLDQLKIPYVALDTNSKVIQYAKQIGCPIIYGNAKQYDLLKAAGIEEATAIILTLSSEEESLGIIKQIQQRYKQVSIICKCIKNSQIKAFLNAGAHFVVSQEQETSLGLAKAVLSKFDFSKQEIREILRQSKL